MPQVLFANPHNYTDIKNNILKIYNLWQNNDLPFENVPENYQQYSRERLTQKLAKTFDTVLKNFYK